MKNFSVFSYQKKGNHAICNDYFKVYRNENSILVLMADGHGGAPYCRSTFGAQLAVYLGKKLLSDFNVDREDFPALFKDRFDRLIKRHLVANPLNDNELTRLGERPRTEAYGTTFMAVYMNNGKTTGFHLGDGEIHAVSEKGTIIPFIRKDKDCYLTFTTSLCQSKDSVISHFRTAEFDGYPLCLTVYTDGYTPLSPYPHKVLGLLAEENHNEKLTNLLETHKTDDDLSFVLITNSILFKSEEYKNALTSTVNGLYAIEKAEKQKQLLTDEYKRLKSYIPHALNVANKLRAAEKAEELRTLIEKLIPMTQRFKYLESILKF